MQNITIGYSKYFIRGKHLGDHKYDTFGHFCQTNMYNENGLLLLASLGKVGKEKDEFRNSNSQLKCYICDLKASYVFPERVPYLL